MGLGGGSRPTSRGSPSPIRSSANRTEGRFRLSKLKKELEKLQDLFNGIKYMERVPDVIIVVDQTLEMTAIQECRKLNIPIISILDTNCDPDLIDIPIPGNDDAVRSIKLILKSLTDSIITGKSKLA